MCIGLRLGDHVPWSDLDLCFSFLYSLIHCIFFDLLHKTFILACSKTLRTVVFQENNLRCVKRIKTISPDPLEDTHSRAEVVRAHLSATIRQRRLWRRTGQVLPSNEERTTSNDELCERIKQTHWKCATIIRQFSSQTCQLND